ncbi:DNA repair protein endonuclease SAE2/CtIP C-terminus-domain-containing protein [Nemania sp. NC0429]|nr:DNA repair protein endonuclease SAE2/CtIP C-terminus-domain-containing protein [Nemania sp. NC0429]
MENWFGDVGRSILLEALGETCDRISSTFETDFQAYAQDKVNLAAELDALKHTAAQIPRLEKENNKLRDEIKALKEANRERTEALRTPLAPRSANLKRPSTADIEGLTISELRAEFLRIDKRYTKLHEKHLGLQNALQKSNQLLRERTTACQKWVDHAKGLREQSMKRAQKIKKLEAKLVEVSQDESLNLSFSSAASDLEAAPEPAIPPSSIDPLTREQSNTPIPAPVALPRHQPTSRRRIDGGGYARRSTSPLGARSLSEPSRSTLPLDDGGLQRTKEMAPCLPPLPQNSESTGVDSYIKPEPSSDTPFIVSERCVRKRKYVGVDESGTTAAAKVKIEHSPQLRASDGRRLFAPHESIDFDSEYHQVDTPRKNTRYQYTENVQDDADDEEHDGNGRIAHPLNHIRDNNRRLTGDASATDPATIHSTDPQADISSALQLLSNGTLPRSRPNLALGNSNRKSSTMPRGLASIAEDGYHNENLNPSNSKSKLRPSILEQLLDTPSPAQEETLPQPSFMIENGRSSDPYLQLPKRRELPFGKDKQKSMGSALKSNPNVSNDKPGRLPRNQSPDKAGVVKDKGKASVSALRHVPKSSLRLDDFKINPLANEGYDYAFTDVVRKKDERACLQGCIKENCCGQKFRALAHAYRAGTRPSEFHALLESYLGDDCHQLSTMSVDEMETLWVEAKTRELANGSGRHRQRYARMSTPPGFWRTDFPNTQEGEADREEAAKMERDIIEERYREAMRPGGLWIFRDE